MKELRLPDDLAAFLKAGRQLEYDISQAEPGRVVLKQLDELYVGSLYVDSEMSPLSGTDPNAARDGYYAVPAVDLIASCEADYPPEGILVWLPGSLDFASWDCDHADLLVFPGVTWTEIATNPLPYLNAQWQPDGVANEFFVPWPRCEFRTDHPRYR